MRNLAATAFGTGTTELLLVSALLLGYGAGSLVHETQICDPVVEPDRCRLLSAIFAGGQVSKAQFSDAMTLFY